MLKRELAKLQQQIGWGGDYAVAIILTALGIISLATAETVPGVTREPDALAYLLAVALAAPLAVRRRWPITILGIFLVCLVIFDARGYAGVNVDFFGPIIAMYTVASRKSARTTIVAAVGVAAAVALAFLLDPNDSATAGDFLTAAIFIVGTSLVGDNVQRRRAYSAELEARTIELEAARHDLARQAVTEERLRMARELHDIVAHTMTAIVVQTAVARHSLGSAPERADAALETIDTMSREGLAELRSIVGVLRSANDDAADLAPTARLSDLPTLVDRVRTNGLDVRLTLEGELSNLSPLVELAAYRIVQEALTNALRHANAARVEVSVRSAPESLSVEVRDDGVPHEGAVAPAVGAGRGLAGMQERATLLGGTFESGRISGGGFRVAARLPLGTKPS